MKIKRIYAENYKTYKNLDLNLEVEEERPIILIGGGNGPLHGVFQPLELIEKKILKQPDLKKRFMLGPDEIITLSDGIQITIYNQWGTNFDGFLRVAQRLFEVKSCG